MTPEEYYIAPSDDTFRDIKENALKIWNTYSDPYRAEKVNRIKDIENIQDNAWFIVAMFDHINQAKLLAMVKPETAAQIQDARGY